MCTCKPCRGNICKKSNQFKRDHTKGKLTTRLYSILHEEQSDTLIFVEKLELLELFNPKERLKKYYFLAHAERVNFVKNGHLLYVCED